MHPQTINMPFFRDVVLRMLLLLVSMGFTNLLVQAALSTLYTCSNEHCSLLAYISLFAAPRVLYDCISSHIEELYYISKNAGRWWRGEIMPEDDPLLQHQIGAHQ